MSESAQYDSDAREISASVTIRGKVFAAAELRIEASVNAVPTMTLQGFFPEDADKTVTSANLSLDAIAKVAAETQQYIMSTERLDPDVKVSITDGAKGADHTLTFEGFLSAPSFGLTGQSAALTYNVLHQSAKLSMFLGNVYGPASVSAAPLSNLDLQSTSFSQLLLKVLGSLMDDFDDYRPTSVSQFYSAIAEPTHARNKKLRSYVESVLTKSEPSTTIPELNDFSNSQLEKMRAVLLEMITGSTNAFDTIARAFPSAFPCIFVPVLNETSPGARLRLLDIVNSKPTDLEVPVDNLGFTAGGAYELPLKGLLVVSGEKPPPLTEVGPDLIEVVSAFYPDSANQATTLAAGGTFLKIAAPSWIPSPCAAVSQDGVNVLREVFDQSPDAEKIDDARLAAAKFWSIDGEEPSANMLKRFAQSHYTYLAFAQSQATVTMPLDVSVQVGRPYLLKVKTKSGSSVPVFTGFVQSISHRLNGNKQSADATTSVVFSHVRTAGFELPNVTPFEVPTV